MEEWSVDPHRIVAKTEWIEARRSLLAKEKELTRLRDRLAEERRALPWVKIKKTYVFDGPEGTVTLAELFDGRSQLFIKHFMMGPGAQTQCVGCSFQVDHIEGVLSHLNNHDVTYASFGRGGEEFLTTYRILDVTPKGRQENGPYHSLTDWVRPRNMYGKGGTVEPNGRYHSPSCACAVYKQG